MSIENVFIVRGLLLRNADTEAMFGMNSKWHQSMPFECEVKAPNLYTAIMCVEGKYGISIVVNVADCGIKLCI